MKKLISRLYRRFFLKKHLFPAGVLIHRKTAKVLFETEFNWYDEDLQPVTVIRAVHNGQIYSVRLLEMLEFKEYAGADPNAGSNI